ncbi:MAG TPA: hypothetical protein VG293_11195 [Solirubrobacteraceae bacterium]|nr:hypothetical protein [Solirubrobacteraceae bacterium]
MADSPIQAVLRALDELDLDGAVAQFAADGLLTTVFGERAEGRVRVREVLGAFLDGLRATRHELESEWNAELGVWLAQVSATYELTDFGRRGPYERAIILRSSDAGIEELRIYGQHEPPLSEAGRGYVEVHGAHHGWLPTL